MSSPRYLMKRIRWSVVALGSGVCCGLLVWLLYLQPPVTTVPVSIVSGSDLAHGVRKGFIKPGDTVRVIISEYPLRKTADPAVWYYVPSSTTVFPPSIRFHFTSATREVVFPVAITCIVDDFSPDEFPRRLNGAPGVLVVRQAVCSPLAIDP